MEVHIILVLMVKNESKILRRCLDAAAPFVDAVLLSDTGSTDDTCEIATGTLTLISADLSRQICLLKSSQFGLEALFFLQRNYFQF